ncbi:MAG TPA: peptidylprolyl isomerase [Candidatus Paceibacterota bacterium]|nr:peptidylprolyl isomerase [Candidatus Paceibacterota bacterium]HRZ99302.1 peptidylprolyl isomerase [Candidatus Paceibacterota bacterium]
MFGTIRKHQQWLWIVIIVIIIISFVVFFSPNVGMDRMGNVKGSFGSIDGQPISREEFSSAYKEAQLRFLFSYGSFPRQDEAARMGFDAEREARNRVFLNRLIQENKIEVPDEAVAQWLANALKDRRQRTFRVDSYDALLKRQLQPQGYSERDLEQFVRHEIGIQQLVAVYGLNGRLVPPQEAERQYRRENEQLLVSVVAFSSSNYLNRVIVNQTNLTQFYSNRLSAYRLPERVEVDYVKFDLTNYQAAGEQQMAKETNLTQRIDAIYQQQGPSFFTDTNGTVLAESEAKAKIREQALKEYVFRAAQLAAAEFAVAIGEMEGTPSATNLAAMAAQKQLVVKKSRPFGQFETPEGLRVPPTFGRTAFALTAEEPVSAPIPAEDGFYVIALTKRISSEVPTFESVRSKVEHDFRAQQASMFAREAGNAFHIQLTNGLAQNKDFASICQAASYKAVDLPAFSLSTSSLPESQGLADFSLLKSLAADLKPGTPSMFTSSRDGGFIVYLKSRTPVDENKLKAELPEYLSELRESRIYEAFNEWVSRQLTVARVSGPPVAAPEEKK